MAAYQKKWTAFENNLLDHLLAHNWDDARIAKYLGRSKMAVQSHKSVTKRSKPKPRWSKTDNLLFKDGIDYLRSYKSIAKKINRTEGAVKVKAARENCYLMKQAMSREKVAELFGIKRDTVVWWVECGAISKHKSLGRIYLIEYDDIISFVDEPRHWAWFDPHKITESALREHAIEIRKGLVFYSVKQVAIMTYYCTKTIVSAIKSGELKATRARGMHFFVRSDWLQTWTNLKGIHSISQPQPQPQPQPTLIAGVGDTTGVT